MDQDHGQGEFLTISFINWGKHLHRGAVSKRKREQRGVTHLLCTIILIEDTPLPTQLCFVKEKDEHTISLIGLSAKLLMILHFTILENRGRLIHRC